MRSAGRNFVLMRSAGSMRPEGGAEDAQSREATPAAVKILANVGRDTGQQTADVAGGVQMRQVPPRRRPARRPSSSTGFGRADGPWQCEQ